MFKKYKREDAIEYAQKWAYSRNPKYYNFDSVGGDCTSFVSQCIYEGSKTMNYNQLGWYYINGNNKSPSWSGVEFLHDFLINNKGKGPFGIQTNKDKIELGDIAQLSFDGYKFSHTLIIVKKDNYNIYVVAHTYDTLNRNIITYDYKKIRYLHIENIRI